MIFRMTVLLWFVCLRWLSQTCVKSNVCFCLNFHILPLSVYLLASQVGLLTNQQRFSLQSHAVLCQLSLSSASAAMPKEGRAFFFEARLPRSNRFRLPCGEMLVSKLKPVDFSCEGLIMFSYIRCYAELLRNPKSGVNIACCIDPSWAG